MDWPAGALTRIPFWVYQSPKLYAQEQHRIYEGPIWNYLCLEAELAKPGDYRTTFVGVMPVVVARDYDNEIYAFENRCAHRGALIALDGGGNARDFTCVYHAWNYDLKGNLKGVAFEDGVAGKGGMPKGFCRSDHGPRKLRIATYCGLVFGSMNDDVPPIEEYLGDEIAKRICERMACGESLRQICRDDDMPTEGAVRGWVIYDHHGFASRYAHARELRADVWADQILDIAREVPADAAHVARAKLEIDAIKWTASKLMPRRYGEHLTTALTGANGGPIKTEQSFTEFKDMSDEDLFTLREILKRYAGPEGEDEGPYRGTGRFGSQSTPTPLEPL